MSETSYALPPAPEGIDAQIGPGRPTPGSTTGEPPRLVITLSRRLLDRTHVVAQRELTVSNGPLPWPGAGPFRVDELGSFAVRLGPRAREVGVIARVDGRDHPLVRRIPHAEQAEYIQAALTAWLEAARR